MTTTARTYPINEIFYSLQGEGFWTGTPAVFVRFSGCNLKCPFCDTDHSSSHQMTANEIVQEVKAHPAKFVVLTGGEPSLFVTDELVNLLHAEGIFIAIETNGTNRLNAAVDWITLSPKDTFVDRAEVSQTECDELKVVFTGKNFQPKYDGIKARWKFVQPCDVGETEGNSQIVAAAVQWVKNNPQWRLSLQTHKLLGIR